MDILLSRDLDSRITFRELAAVQEWLTTPDKSIHAMRDNPAHNIGLLGASWGTDLTKGELFSKNLSNLLFSELF